MKSIEYVPPGGYPEGLELRSVPVKGYETLCINQVGHIRSCLKRGDWGLDTKWNAVGIFRTGDGPWWFRFNHGARHSATVASLVMEAFGPEKPGPGYGIYPIDGNLENHCAWNLVWLDYDQSLARGLQSCRFKMFKIQKAAKPGDVIRKKPNVTNEELLEVVIEFNRTKRKLRRIWEDRFRGRINFPNFSVRVHKLRRKQKEQ